MEKVLAGAIRREMLRDEQCAKQAAEIRQLNRLVGVLLLPLISGVETPEIIFFHLKCCLFAGATI